MQFMINSAAWTTTAATTHRQDHSCSSELRDFTCIGPQNSFTEAVQAPPLRAGKTKCRNIFLDCQIRVYTRIEPDNLAELQACVRQKLVAAGAAVTELSSAIDVRIREIALPTSAAGKRDKSAIKPSFSEGKRAVNNS